MNMDDTLRALEEHNNKLMYKLTNLNDSIEIEWLAIGTLLQKIEPEMQTCLDHKDSYITVYHLMCSDDPIAEIDVQIRKLTANAVECEARSAKLWRWNPNKKRLLERAGEYRDDTKVLEDIRSRVPGVLDGVAAIEAQMQTITEELQRIARCITQKKECILKEAMEDCEQ